MNSGLITGLIAGPNRLSKAVLSRKQAIPDAEIVQALANLHINALAGIITTFPTTTSTLAALQTAQTFTLDNEFSSTTVSSSVTTGAVKIAGGLGVVGAGYFQSLNAQSGEIAGLSLIVGLNGLTNAGPTTLASTLSLTLNTDATSSSAGGTLTVTGGAAVSKKLFVGTLLDLVATTATAGQITQAGSVIFHTFRTDNLFLGSGAGNFGATLGSNNIGIGKSSLAACTTGTSNTAIGRITLSVLTSGSNNVALGDDTGTAITDGEYNILVGRNAGKNINTGDYNSAIGGIALTTCTSGGANVAIGYQSLGSTNASNNSAVGFNSGYYSTGNNGTYIGHSAGIATATVGGLAGVAITSGVNNTMIGTSSSSTSATGTYRTAIGSDSRCQNNNAIKLGRDTLDVVILPSMTTAVRDAVSSPAGGSFIFNSTTNKLNFYNGTGWEAVTSA